MERRLKVCHITSAHKLNDVRIHLKECLSLAKNYEVSLLGNDESFKDIDGKVKVINLNKPINSRIERFINLKKDLLKEALKINADIYHVHDPDLLGICLSLRKKNKIVIFDSHEDVPKQILAKQYLPKIIRPVISKVYYSYEKYVTSKLDAIVAATPNIRDKFLKFNKNTIDINNYPLLDEFYISKDINFKERKRQIVYVGGLSKERGIEQMIKLAELLPSFEFKFAGKFSNKNEESVYLSNINNKNIEFLGQLDRIEIVNLLTTSMYGLVLLEKNERYSESLPIKMFEYMASGLPFIATDFELWKNIINESQSGFFANPYDLNKIKKIINENSDNIEGLQAHSENGIEYVFKQCNWENEEKKLLNLYKKLEEN